MCPSMGFDESSGSTPVSLLDTLPLRPGGKGKDASSAGKWLLPLTSGVTLVRMASSSSKEGTAFGSAVILQEPFREGLVGGSPQTTSTRTRSLGVLSVTAVLPLGRALSRLGLRGGCVRRQAGSLFPGAGLLRS